jgi:ribosomal protein S18 acetylase RimI-like enzyme
MAPAGYRIPAAENTCGERGTLPARDAVLRPGVRRRGEAVPDDADSRRANPASTAFRVRPYRREDRAGVRRVTFETGYMGDPIDWLWRDPESFADLLTTYYTDREPESLLVVDRGGEVVGYLLGCLESARTWGVSARAARRLVRRGGLLRPGIAGFLWRSIFDALGDHGVPDEYLDDARWPAHLHINLLPEARGRGAGAALMNTWLERLRERDCPGVHLGTFFENHNAIAFFESRGFRRYGGPMPAPGFRTRAGERMHVQWMVQSLRGSAPC